MMQSFAGKVALVTGGGAGIGRATSLAFAHDGARVIVSDVDTKGGEETVRLIREAGSEAHFVHADVSNATQIASLIDETLTMYGRLDYACNNAGIGGESHPTADYPEDAWRRVIDINLTGVWLCMKYEIPEMLHAGGGAIVNMSSILGTVGFANSAAYVAAKHGLIGLTQTAALEYATQGLRINAVCPGFIVTPMLEHAGLLSDPVAHEMLINLHPLKRLGTPEEVAEAVVWLCSDASSFVTGHALLVDGGYVAQ
jgi:NAD(P)-dependent dehydrogenase (short-subunit alcohol dehydrogenase family)